MRLVSPSKSTPKYNSKHKMANLPIVPPTLANRLPLYVTDIEDFEDTDSIQLKKVKELRFDSIIVRQHKFSVKSGRPVAFLTAQPRFEEDTEFVPLPRRRRSSAMKKSMFISFTLVL